MLVQIYESYGYTTREAVESIVKNNLYGMDIDARAAQLAYFTVMMKADSLAARFSQTSMRFRRVTVLTAMHWNTSAMAMPS